MSEQPTTKGWAKPVGARKRHYFVSGSSLCMRWHWVGGAHMLDDTNHLIPENCVVCFRRRTVRQPQAA